MKNACPEVLLLFVLNTILYSPPGGHGLPLTDIYCGRWRANQVLSQGGPVPVGLGHVRWSAVSFFDNTAPQWFYSQDSGILISCIQKTCRSCTATHEAPKGMLRLGGYAAGPTWVKEAGWLGGHTAHRRTSALGTRRHPAFCSLGAATCPHTVGVQDMLAEFDSK